jgi:hypothetical protein
MKRIVLALYVLSLIALWFVAHTAARTVTGGSITGTTASFGGGNVTMNSSGITITQGTGATQRLNFSDGSFVRSSSDAIMVFSEDLVYLASGTTGGNSVLTWDGTKFFGGNGHPDLGGSTNRWKDLYLNGNISNSALSGTGDDYACINSSGQIFRSDTAC